MRAFGSRRTTAATANARHSRVSCSLRTKVSSSPSSAQLNASRPAEVVFARVSAETCSLCGRPLDAHDRDVRFGLPDRIFELPEEKRQLSWGGQAMVAARGIGQFVRVLLPVRLTGGYKIRFWRGVSVSDHDAPDAPGGCSAPAGKEMTLY